MDCPLPPPVGESAPSLFKQGKERPTVPNVHDRVEHDVGPSRRYQHVTVSVAPGAARVHLPLQLFCGWPKCILLSCPKIRRQEQGLAKRFSCRDPRRLTVPETTEPARSVDQLIQGRKINRS